MIDVGVGMEELPADVVGVAPEIGLHILVNFLLKVDTNHAIDADDFVGTDAGAGWNVAVGIGNADVGGFVADVVLSTFDCGRDEFLSEGDARASSALSGREANAGRQEKR